MIDVKLIISGGFPVGDIIYEAVAIEDPTIDETEDITPQMEASADSMLPIFTTLASYNIEIISPS